MLDVVELTSDLVAIPSPSTVSNRTVADHAAQVLEGAGFEVTAHSYRDSADVEKVNLIARKGQGCGGLGFFSHLDVVPGGDGWEPFAPCVAGGRLYGRGSCDMKGPLAASIAAAAQIDASALARPLVIVLTADEEIGHLGAKFLARGDNPLTRNWPDFGVICEPTGLVPVYAHKGAIMIEVVAHGVAAHTSTDIGVSANFKIAPFLAEMTALNRRFRSERRFMNDDFVPPTNGFNMVFDDGGTARNVTAARTVCSLVLRPMPNAATDDAVEMIVARARAHDLEVTVNRTVDFFQTAPDGILPQAACAATGVRAPITVSFCTEADTYQRYLQTVVLGPGNIEQAHTCGEWIDIDELRRAVDVYGKLIARLSGNP